MTIYERIKQLRLQLGMSQEELAKKVGYEGKSAISKVENGERDISHSMLIKYAEALHVTPSYLLTGSDSDNSSHSIDNFHPKKDWSGILKEAIKKSGLTFRELETLSGVPHSAIQRYASGATDKIPVGRIERIANALGISAEKILDRDTVSLFPTTPRFSKEDAILAIALWNTLDNVDEQDIEDVKRFAALIREKKTNK